MNPLQTEAVRLIEKLAKDHCNWYVHEYDSSKDDPGDPRGGGIIRTLRYKANGADILSVSAELWNDAAVFVGQDRIGILGELGPLKETFRGILSRLETDRTLATLRVAVNSLRGAVYGGGGRD